LVPLSKLVRERYKRNVRTPSFPAAAATREANNDTAVPL